MGWLLGLVRPAGSRGPFGAATVPKNVSLAKSIGGSRAPPDRRWWLAIAGSALLHLSHPVTWKLGLPGAWFPPAGVGLLLVAWLGPRAALLVVADALLVALQAWIFGSMVPWGSGWPAMAGAVWDALLSGAEVWLAWWIYQRVAGGARRLFDPRSASLFLFLVPGMTVGLIVVARAFTLQQADVAGIWLWIGACWLSRALAVLALAPPLLVTLTPWLVRHGLAAPERPDAEQSRGALPHQGFGDGLEIAGLALGTGTLGLLLVAAQGQQSAVGWQLWVLPLLLIVWASLRQGVRGGTIVAAAAVGLCTTLVPFLENGDLFILPLQGYLLAQCSTALLVGVSFSWIYASESRYRQVVEHIPVVLYSARLLEPAHPTIRPRATEITFVSLACKEVIGCPSEELLCDYEHWLQRVHPEDRELVLAALAQLSRYKQPVTFEYRLARSGDDSGSVFEHLDGAVEDGDGPSPNVRAETLRSYARALSRARAYRWARDTLVPVLSADGQLVGWEGVIADITEQRVVADDLRRTTNMFHALTANLPAGIFFVHAPSGRPILVNARARQLLGQRENVAAELSQWPEVYHLHRPDGTPYPADDLPVCMALCRGVTSMRDDIIVHRPDGRRVPLTSWAAPIDLNGKGCTDAAVWVLEDLTDLRQTEVRRRESSADARRPVTPAANKLIVYDAPDSPRSET